MPPVQATIAITPGSGQLLDAVSLVISAQTVIREITVIGDPSNPTSLAGVTVGGALQVDGSAVTQPVFGTLTPNNAAPDGHNIGVLPAIANVSHPTYTEGDLVLLSTDLTGALRVSITGTIIATNNITEWDSVALGSPSAYGTSPGAVNVIGVNAFVTALPALPAGTNVIGHVIVDSGTITTVSTVTAVTSITNPVAVTGTFFQATQPVSIASGQVASGAFASGSIASGAIASGAIAAGAAAAGAFADGSVFVRSNAASTFPVLADIVGHTGVALDAVLGATKPANVLQIGGNDGTNAYAVPLAAGGASVIVSGTVSIGSGPFVVTGNLTNNNAAPSTTNIGALTAVANAADPTWTETELVTASVTLAGYQRVILHAETTKVLGTIRITGNIGGIFDAVVGAAIPANAIQVGGSDGTDLRALLTSATGQLHVLADSGSTTAVTGVVEVAPTGSANTKTNPFFNQLADGTNAAALTAFGTAPATSIYALAVEAALVANVAGTPTALTATGTSLNVNITGGSSGNAAASATGSAVPASADYQGVNVGGTLRGQTGVNPTGSIYAAQTDITSLNGVSLGSPANYGTSPGAVEVIGVNAFVTNNVAVTLSAETTKVIGTVNIAASQTIAVTQATASNLNAAIVGTQTNNNAAPGATNVGVLPGIANAANPAWTEGDQVLLSEDLSGRLRIMGQVAAGASITGNPVVIGGSNGGVAISLVASNAGILAIGNFATPGDALANSTVQLAIPGSSGLAPLEVMPVVFNGSTWDRRRSATIGNAVVATGIAASAAYGEYLSTAPAPTTGQYSALQTDNAGSLFVKNTRRSQTAAQGTTITTSTAATAVTATPAANTFADLSQLIITVTPIAVTAIAFTATLSDGTNTYIYDIDTGVTAAGGGSAISINFNPPLPATSAATGWTIALSVNTVVAHVTTIVVLQKAS